MRLMENDFTKQFLANLVLYGENKLDENSLSVQVAKFNLNDHYFKGLRKTRINEYMSDGFIVSIKICVEQRRTNSNTHKILNLLLTSHLQFGNIKFCSKIAKNAKQAKSMFEFSQPFSIVLKKK